MSEINFGECKICGGTTYNVDGGSYLCKNMNCPAWYYPQEGLVYVRLTDGREGYCKKNRLPEDAVVLE